ncbi:hypothetical protein H6800_00225 [Candidatus Nomurabacteria bacterium]|nr:hypothetical protein [Candidatus Nomurabacteria bacterium]
MVDYRILLDIYKDAENWLEASQNKSKLKQWATDFDPKFFNELKSHNEEDATTLLIEYLKGLYLSDKNNIAEYKKFIESEFKSKFKEACDALEMLTGKPLYRQDFTVYLTTFPRGPYNYDNGELWVAIGWYDPIRNFMHELLHFQTIYYWRNKVPAVINMTGDEFEILKESLTVVLDESLEPLIKSPDKGYEQHREIRVKLHEYWIKNKNFDSLIKQGVKILNESKNN